MSKIKNITVHEPIIMKHEPITTQQSANIKLLHTERFTKDIREALQAKHTIKLDFKDDNLVHAKINTNTKLKAAQLDLLTHYVFKWGFKDLEISRSGAGLKIEYNPKNKSND